MGKAEVILKASYYKKMAGKSDPKLHKVEKERCEKRTLDLKAKVILAIGGLVIIALGILAIVLGGKKRRRNTRRRKRNSQSGNGRSRKTRKTTEKQRKRRDLPRE